MYYKLKQPYALRGWDKLPYALINRNEGTVVFLNKTEYDALSLCDGIIDADSLLIAQGYRDIIDKLVENHIVERCEKADEICSWQKHMQYPARFIKTAHWSITGKCNYRCKHCFMSAPDAKLGELSHEQCMSIIDQLHECGIMHVTLTGGEPLVRKDFLDIVDKLIGYHIKIDTIYSNGKLVTSELLDELEKRGVKPEFNLSFDGVGWHDWMRGVPNAEKYAIDAFRLCNERGFPTAAETALHKKNAHTLRDTINLLADLGVGHVKVNPVALAGAWFENAGDDGLSINEVFEYYLDYVHHFFEDGAPLTLMLGGFFYARKGEKKYRIPAMKFCNSEKAASQCICGHARLTMYIAADGRTLPCMPLSGMTISEQYPLITQVGLSKCITNSAYMDLIDTRLSQYLEQNPECNACEYRYVCGGGCRAGALMTTPGDIMAPDRSTCEIFMQGYPEKIKQRLADMPEIQSYHKFTSLT